MKIIFITSIFWIAISLSGYGDGCRSCSSKSSNPSDVSDKSSSFGKSNSSSSFRDRYPKMRGIRSLGGARFVDANEQYKRLGLSTGNNAPKIN